jgi:hypothetical protein
MTSVARLICGFVDLFLEPEPIVSVEPFMLLQDMITRELIALSKATCAGNCIVHCPNHLIIVGEFFVQLLKLSGDEIPNKVRRFLQCWMEPHNLQDAYTIEFALTFYGIPLQRRLRADSSLVDYTWKRRRKHSVITRRPE